ncbi:hypothetical protein TL16_g12101 [Triparma laevis f. inornata]|uniref:SET domain-containing protein n=2 Tax=Triparma laevis TaxID=1534972 RepID=A0A9W7AAW3_9STRA|nr:hypothetical protein TrLO_g15207 [Triparma laevis f. longispina]GMH91602.1 hypothetical protein TL16_g12101 [Triparma laevis f. inornata]
MIEYSQKDGGKGLRSTTFIKSGTLIFCDLATLRCPNSFPASSESEAQALQNSCVETRFSHLSLSSRTSLMTLASHVSPSSPTIAGIFQTNAVRLQGRDSADGAIFETFCRMNHSCNPNVSHQWKDDLQRLGEKRGLSRGSEVIDPVLREPVSREPVSREPVSRERSEY